MPKINGGLPDDQGSIDQSSSSEVFLPRLPYSLQNDYVVLYLVETGDFIRVGEKTKFTIGRTGDGQEVIPDIDLTPYDAYSSGVSRLHLSIVVSQSEIAFRDLESANGTRLNGTRITSQTKHILKHGDILTLGTLKVQILTLA